MARLKLSELGEWAQKSELRMEAVVKTTLQDMVDDMQEPRAKGGRMPVDTGFLRNSIGAALNSDGSTGGEVTTTINRLKIGDSITIGWAANYSRYMNNRYGFMDLPIQDFQNYVFRAVEKVKT